MVLGLVEKKEGSQSAFLHKSSLLGCSSVFSFFKDSFVSNLDVPENAQVLKRIDAALSNGCEIRKVNNEWVGYYYLIDKDSIEVKMPLCWVNDEKMMVIVCDLNHGVLNYVFSELTQASLVDSKRISHLLYNFIYIDDYGFSLLSQTVCQYQLDVEKWIGDYIDDNMSKLNEFLYLKDSVKRRVKADVDKGVDVKRTWIQAMRLNFYDFNPHEEFTALYHLEDFSDVRYTPGKELSFLSYVADKEAFKQRFKQSLDTYALDENLNFIHNILRKLVIDKRKGWDR